MTANINYASWFKKQDSDSFQAGKWSKTVSRLHIALIFLAFFITISLPQDLVAQEIPSDLSTQTIPLGTSDLFSGQVSDQISEVTINQEEYLKKIQIFRIGTGGIAGTYYPIGGMIAQAISSPPGARPCNEGGSCGVPGLVAIAQSSNGSVANIHSIAKGELESGFAQSDVVYWAYKGEGVFKGKSPVTDIRVIANLYPETLHLVARIGSGIKSVADLRGKRVSLDEAGSGTLVDARILLKAYGLNEKDLRTEYIKPELAIGKIERGELDAFFIVTGYPTPSVSKLASGVGATLVPIGGRETIGLLERWSFFSSDRVPANTYKGIPETPTISVGAQWIVGSGIDEELVYQITKSLWNATSRHILNSGHSKGKVIDLKRALEGIAIPLHPGAERFYREMGVLK